QAVTDGVIPKRRSLEEALGDIRVHAAAPYTAGVLRDSDGEPIATRYAYADEDGNAREEITGVARDLRALGVDVDGPDQNTVILVRDATSGTVIDSASYDLNGELLMFEMRREPLIKSSSISLQKLINK